MLRRGQSQEHKGLCDLPLSDIFAVALHPRIEWLRIRGTGDGDAPDLVALERYVGFVNGFVNNVVGGAARQPRQM